MRAGAIQLRKVNGLVTWADICTTHFCSRKGKIVVELFNCEYRDGRTQTETSKADGQVATIDHDDKHNVNDTGPVHDPDFPEKLCG